jgi:hypothetical protein
MKDEDLRDFFAGLALMGFASRGIHMDVINTVATNAYALADAMIGAKYVELIPEPEEGITAIKPKRKRSTNVPAVNDTERSN